MRHRPLYWTLDECGVPVPVNDLAEGRKLRVTEEFDNPHVNVGHDTLKSSRLRYPRTEVFLSTKFLGIDLSHGSGPPLLWETMAFLVDKSPAELDWPASEKTWGNELLCRRHATLQEAQRAHAEAKQMLKLMLQSPEAADLEWARTYCDAFYYGTEEETPHAPSEEIPSTE